jgi:CheY-like chemotaxis protein
VYDGREAIAQAVTFAPDMVLMDIGMPDLDGYEAASRIRCGPRNTNVLLVAVTCFDQQQDRDRALASGFDVHVPKPVSFTTLLGLLKMLQNRKVLS